MLSHRATSEAFELGAFAGSCSRSNGHPKDLRRYQSRKLPCSLFGTVSRQSVEYQNAGNLTLNHLSGKRTVSPTIDARRTVAMILLGEPGSASGLNGLSYAKLVEYT